MAGVMVLGSCGGIAELLGLEEDEEESSSELSSDIIDVAAAVFETDAEDLECVLVLDNDGATWAQKSIPTFTAVYVFASDGDQVIAAAQERFFYSTDGGETWSEKFTDEDGTTGDVSFQTLKLTAIGYSSVNGGHWVATGPGGVSGGTVIGPPVVLHSTDGIDWTESENAIHSGYVTSLATDGSNWDSRGTGFSILGAAYVPLVE